MSDVSLGLNERSCHVVPDVDQVQNSVTDELSQIRVWLESPWQAHQPRGLFLQDFKLQVLANPMQNNQHASHLSVQIYQEQYTKHYVQHHLRKKRCKLAVDSQLIEMEVKHILVQLRLFVFQYFKVLNALVHLVLLSLDHYYRV